MAKRPMLKTDEIVGHVFHTTSGAEVPIRQMHLWLHVNHWRSRDGRPPIKRLRFSRILYAMQAKGIIKRTYWATPCDDNMWSWTE